MFFRKAKHIQLSIPDPCSQSWQGMTPVNGGRHCAQCSKTVTDFTSMTDLELFTWFKSGRSTCGQFYTDQLERAIAAPREPRHSFWMKLGVALITLLGFAKEGHAQDKKTAPVAAMPSPSAEESTSISAPQTNTSEIKGTITDDKGEGIPGASVTLKDSSGRTLAFSSTDVNGEYELSINVQDSVTATLAIHSISQEAIITDIAAFPNRTIIVNHQFTKPDIRLETIRIVRGRAQPLLDTRGVHTTHVMKDWE